MLFRSLKVYAVKPGSGGAAYARQTIERTAFLPPAAQTFAYDADGNLTNDGVWTYAWDAERAGPRWKVLRASSTRHRSGGNNLSRVHT